MIAAPYDIFRRDLLGTPVWIEPVQDFETAQLHVLQLTGRSPGEYFVFREKTQEIVSSTAPRLSELASLAPVSSRIENRISFSVSESGPCDAVSARSSECLPLGSS